MPRLPTGAPAAVAIFLMLTATVGLTASNTVPTTHAEQDVRAITPDDLKPATCAALTLTTLITDGTGSAGNDLVLGSAAGESIDGKSGSDCILGGGGADSISGSANDDVILGGDGDDTIDGGPGNDTCYGQGGTDTFLNCETTVQ